MKHPHLHIEPSLPAKVIDPSTRNVKREDGTEYDGQIHEKTLKLQKAHAGKGSRGGPKAKKEKAS